MPIANQGKDPTLDLAIQITLPPNSLMRVLRNPSVIGRGAHVGLACPTFDSSNAQGNRSLSDTVATGCNGTSFGTPAEFDHTGRPRWPVWTAVKQHRSKERVYRRRFPARLCGPRLRDPSGDRRILLEY